MKEPMKDEDLLQHKYKMPEEGATVLTAVQLVSDLLALMLSGAMHPKYLIHGSLSALESSGRTIGVAQQMAFTEDGKPVPVPKGSRPVIDLLKHKLSASVRKEGEGTKDWLRRALEEVEGEKGKKENDGEG